MQKEVFGIIGGAGVAATNKLNEEIERITTLAGALRDQHHPEVISYQATSAPSRSMYFEGRGPSFISHYIEIAQKLEAAGATVLSMNCNTAHAAFEQISSATNVTFINLIYEVARQVKDAGLNHVGLLASDGTLKAGIYGACFAELIPEVCLIYPSDKEQSIVTAGIQNVKNENRLERANHPERPNNQFNQVIRRLRQRGAEGIILGCTDISVDFECQDADLKVVDSTIVLAEKIFEMHMQSNRLQFSV